jgi:hypothetical protein
MVGQGVNEVAGVEGNPFWGLGRGDAHRRALSTVARQRWGSLPASNWRGSGGRDSTGQGGGWCTRGPRGGASQAEGWPK